MKMETFDRQTFPASVQPGIPKLSAPKAGWRRFRLGEILEEVQRPIRLECEATYRLLTVKRSRGGVEERGMLKGDEIAVKSQFEVQDGDFLISKRQIVHGACGVVPARLSGSIVSNEYSVLRPTPALDLDFLRLMSHTVYFQQTCFHSCIGVHIEKMLFKLEQWLDAPINIPLLTEQRQIADRLCTVEARLGLLLGRQDALTRYKAGLAQKLFSQEIRFTREDGSEFPEWQKRPVTDVGTFMKGKGISRQDVEVDGVTPCIRYGEIYTQYAERILEIASRPPPGSDADPCWHRGDR